MASEENIIKYVGDNLGALFRHLIPGALILGATAVAQPTWFTPLDVTKGQWMVILAVLAIAIGNAWFVVHRYFIQQLVDVCFWAFKAANGPRRGSPYHSAVADHVWNFFTSNLSQEEFRRHIRFRTSAVILLYIVAEILFLSGFLASCSSIISPCRGWIIALGVLLFLAAVWQNFITRYLEGKLLIAPNPSFNPDAASTGKNLPPTS